MSRKIATRVLVSLAVLAGTLFVPASAASADGTCPPKFVSASTAPGVDPDRNGNTVVCMFITPGGHFVLIDDH